MGQRYFRRSTFSRILIAHLAGKKRTALMPTSPTVSVILVSWNSTDFLPHCLDCLSLQTFQDFEIILIDNGSVNWGTDGLEQKYPDLNLRIERLASNRGFAVANNMGAHLARGKWLALLNTDAFPTPDWLEKLLQAAEANQEFRFFASRQLQANAPELLDGAGDAYHISGLGWRRYYNLRSENHALEAEEVFSPCGAAALYLRDDFLQAGGFDEDYFSYFEDVDLGFRLRLNGKKCLYVPQAVVWHVGSASTQKRSNFSVYYGYRNMVWTFVKDMPGILFLLYLPVHVGTILFFILYLTLRNQSHVIWRAVFDAISGLPRAFTKRRIIQQNRKVRPQELIPILSTGLLEPYSEFIKRNGRK
jgi:GT2 family glycosyltransferase